jgi:peroxiredoxin
LGASFVAISPQLEKYSKQIVKKLDLTFPVLSDSGNKVAAQFGLVFTLPTDLQQVYKGFGIDLERINGNSNWTLAMPSRFIVDHQGIVISAEVHPDYTCRPEPSDILNVLNRPR